LKIDRSQERRKKPVEPSKGFTGILLPITAENADARRIEALTGQGRIKNGL